MVFKNAAYEVKTQTPTLTDESIVEARSLIGIELDRSQHIWNSAATRDAIRHFAEGIGDNNPLWSDEEYARKTKWGGIIAPPCFLYTVDVGPIAPKLRGIQWIYAGTDFTFYRPMLVDDKFKVKAKLVDAVERTGRHASRMILQVGEKLISNQRDELVARILTKCMRVPRARADGGLKYAPRQPHKYTEAELRAIEDAFDREEIRGAVPRYWEDVAVGDELTPVVKGPLNITDMVVFYCGAGTVYQAHGNAIRRRRRHPAEAYVDPETGAQDHPARGHQQEHMAMEVGMPGIYDVGSQRISWVGNVLTNWMGDDGFLKRLNIDLRRPNVFGDTTYCKGTVTKKWIQDEERLVECDVWTVNQNGEVTAQGTATIALPSRAA